jgi:Protein kinase domain
MMRQGQLLAGRYELGAQLGVGGMATVYLARDWVLGRLVAVKLVDPAGQVKVTDFGIATATTDAQSMDGAPVWGTAAYLSPEQARGRPAEARSDVYSLGCVLYELLTGADRPTVPLQPVPPAAVAAGRREVDCRRYERAADPHRCADDHTAVHQRILVHHPAAVHDLGTSRRQRAGRPGRAGRGACRRPAGGHR